MGMFDSFDLSQIEMPDGKFYEEEFQTKELDCNMDQYRVTRDGRLVMRSHPRDLWQTVQGQIAVNLYGPINVRLGFMAGTLRWVEMKS